MVPETTILKLLNSMLFCIGQSPPDVTEIGTAMISFLWQFQHYIPIDATPVNPCHYLELLETATITAYPNEVYKWSMDSPSL